jgi:L-fucose/D-arabinose isomerase
MSIAVAYFGLPPVYTRKTDFPPKDELLPGILSDNGYQLTEAVITAAGDLHRASAQFKEGGCSCLIVSLSSWTRIPLVVQLVKSCRLPTALYARTSGSRNGITALTAASASLAETNRNDSGHRRFMEGMEPELLRWLEAVQALSGIRSAKLLCWGAGYGADIPYTRSDPAYIEQKLAAEVLYEQESVLTAKAERILSDEPGRSTAFLNRLAASGLRITRDSSMVTEQALQRQAALYLAARERLRELSDERIRGVSIKCHFELSTTVWGCTACFLPAFLPFPENEEDGLETIIPVACEGDLNGLVSSVLLHALNPAVPPLFGDFVSYNPEFTLLRNCGASSVFWAGLSCSPHESFPWAELRANMHGKSGAALHYETPAADAVTACRLFRQGQHWGMMFGAGRIVSEAESGVSYPDPWPHTRLDFGVDEKLLFETYPCNHSSVTLGCWTEQLEEICRMTGIEAVRLDSAEQLTAFRERMRSNGNC